MAPILLLLAGAAAPALENDDGIIRYGMVADSPPTTFVDSDGNPTGFYIELFTRIMAEFGYEPEFIIGPFPEIYRKILDNEVDLFSSLLRTEEREDQIFWPSEPTGYGWGQVFVPAGGRIDGVDDLKGRRIALMPGEANGENFLAYMEGLGVDFEPVYAETFDALIAAVLDGGADGGVAANAFLLGRQDVQGTNIVFSPLPAYTTCSASNERMIPLVEAFSDRLRFLKEDPGSYYWDLYDAWMATERIETTVVPIWLLWSLSVAVAMIVTSLIVIRILKFRVDARNRELEEINRTLEEKVRERTRDLERAFDRLVRAEKSALTANLVSGVAHEINTPLGVAITSLSYLKNLVEPNSGRREWSETLTLAENNLKRAAGLVEQFAFLSADRHSSAIRPVDTVKFIAEIIGSMETEIGNAGCSVETDLAEAEIPVSAGSFALVVAHLIRNALAHAYGTDGGLIVVRSALESDEFLVHIEDSGAGIAAENLDRIFEPFFGTHRSEGHAGLGLSIVENVVRDNLGGRIEVDSDPGVRTRFTIRVPRNANPQA